MLPVRKALVGVGAGSCDFGWIGSPALSARVFRFGSGGATPLSFAARFVGMDDIWARALLWESEISLRPVEEAVAVAVAAYVVGSRNLVEAGLRAFLFSELSMVSVRMRGMMLFTSTHEPSSNAPYVEDSDGAVVKAVVLLFGHALPLSQ